METVKLVQSYLKTIDELRTLGQIYKKKLGFLNRLSVDCRDIENDLRRNRETEEVDEEMTMSGRVKWATLAVRDLDEQCDQLTKVMVASLTSASKFCKDECLVLTLGIAFSTSVNRAK